MKKVILPFISVLFLAVIAEATNLLNNLKVDTSSYIYQNKIDSVGMNNQKLEGILKKQGEIIESREGYWQLNYLNRILIVITDQKNNRMRIITPVIEEKEMKKSNYSEVLKAQFDRALDVKYALYNGLLWSIFVHPLKELTQSQLIDAISQVFYAAHNFGGSYRSTNLQFGSGDK